MGFGDLMRWLLPKEDHFYGFLERQAVVNQQAAQALAGFKNGTTAAAVRGAVEGLERQGDQIVHEMEEALAATFVTPLDREDLHAVCAELEQILNLTNEAARGCDLFGVDRLTPAMTSLVELLAKATGVLAEAVPELRKSAFGKIIETCRSMRKLEKEADAIFRSAVSALFHDPAVDAKALLREKEVLEDLETAIDHCAHLADRLANLAVKHG